MYQYAERLEIPELQRKSSKRLIDALKAGTQSGVAYLVMELAMARTPNHDEILRPAIIRCAVCYEDDDFYGDETPENFRKIMSDHERMAVNVASSMHDDNVMNGNNKGKRKIIEVLMDAYNFGKVCCNCGSHDTRVTMDLKKSNPNIKLKCYDCDTLRELRMSELDSWKGWKARKFNP